MHEDAFSPRHKWIEMVHNATVFLRVLFVGLVFAIKESLKIEDNAI